MYTVRTKDIPTTTIVPTGETLEREEEAEECTEPHPEACYILCTMKTKQTKKKIKKSKKVKSNLPGNTATVGLGNPHPPNQLASTTA